jgi:hypothetical protein
VELSLVLCLFSLIPVGCVLKEVARKASTSFLNSDIEEGRDIPVTSGHFWEGVVVGGPEWRGRRTIMERKGSRHDLGDEGHKKSNGRVVFMYHYKYLMIINSSSRLGVFIYISWIFVGNCSPRGLLAMHIGVFGLP